MVFSKRLLHAAAQYITYAPTDIPMPETLTGFKPCNGGGHRSVVLKTSEYKAYTVAKYSRIGTGAALEMHSHIQVIWQRFMAAKSGGFWPVVATAGLIKCPAFG
jgi:hypothetical protein